MRGFFLGFPGDAELVMDLLSETYHSQGLSRAVGYAADEAIGIDSKLRGCDLVALRVRDVSHGEPAARRRREDAPGPGATRIGCVMPAFILKDERHFITYITGPSHVLLGIRFTGEPAEPMLFKQPDDSPRYNLYRHAARLLVRHYALGDAFKPSDG